MRSLHFLQALPECWAILELEARLVCFDRICITPQSVESGAFSRETLGPGRVHPDALRTPDEPSLCEYDALITRSHAPAPHPPVLPHTASFLPWRHCGSTRGRGLLGRARSPWRTGRWPSRSSSRRTPCCLRLSGHQPVLSRRERSARMKVARMTME